MAENYLIGENKSLRKYTGQGVINEVSSTSEIKDSSKIYEVNNNLYYLKNGTPTLIGSGGGGGGGGVVSVLWSELKALRDGGTLSEGTFYRITDYDCVLNPYSAWVTSAHHGYDIIIVATSAKTLSEEALATQREGDTYFNYAKLEGWQLKYCLDNDQTRFNWCGSDTDGGKGVVYWMKDERGNECDYDFKNVKMLRYEIKTSTDGMTNSRAFTAEITSAVMPWTVDKTNKYYFYTFSLCPNTTLTESDVFDLSVYNSSAFSNFFFSNNKLSSAGGVLGGASSSTESFSPSCFIIANTQNAYTTIDLTSFSVRLFDNEAKGQFSGNTFNCGEISSTSSASIVFNNYFGSFVKLCTFGRSFCSNIIEGALVSSSFSNSCTLNYIGKGCSVLTFYYGCNKNIIESSCTGITLESANTNTKIGSACSSITIGTSCDANIFNPNCKSITLSSCKALFFGPRVNWGGSSTRSYTNKEGAQVWT